MGERKTAAEVADILRRYRFSFTDEDELHQGIAQALKKNGVSFVHEKTLSRKDRIDFLCDGGIGIEVKVDGSPSAVGRQVLDYLKFEEVSEVVLVTSRVLAAAYLREPTSSGKKIEIVELWGTRL